ncbi:MAG TPA: phosphoglycerate dehydrogenase [Candidatus Saccharimonadales bacterium]|nr:phosphoglycerate dehydrogenase [Candidatus Saccharimonadales bacterium]
MSASKRILITDKISGKALEIFGADPDLEADYRPGLSGDDLSAAVAEASALVVRSQTKVTAGLIRAATRLKVIGRAGTGVDNVDVETATRAGVVVMNVPGGNTLSAAEHTFSLMLALARKIPGAARSMAEGRWERGKFLGTELYGKTLGVLGVGRIGREVARRARAFGMEVIGYDPFLPEEMIDKVGVELVELPEILRRADFITVHTPMTPATRHLIGAEQIAQCKPGVRIVNCARGGIVDEQAVASALEEGKIGGAAFDVYEKEPPGDLPFRDHPDVICTPHLAASTEEAQERVAVEIAEQIRDYLRDGTVRNAVNLATLDPRTEEKARPFLGLAWKLGKLHAQLMDGNPREIVVEIGGDVPEEAAAPLSVAVLRGFLESHLSGPVNEVNAALIAGERGIRLREIRSAAAVDFTNLITVAAESSAASRRISGTLFGRNLPRIVRLDGYHFDALPEGKLLFVSNDDRPGIIGLIGTTMGRNGINIAYMNVGRDRSGGQAIAILNLDSEVPEPALRELRAAPGITWVRQASL